MGRVLELQPIVARLQRAPDAVVLPFLARLRERKEELAEALNGRSLRAEIVVQATRRVVYRIVFTPTGHVELTGSYGFDPHLRFQGAPEQLLDLLVGDVDTFSAVERQVLTLYFPAEDLLHYPRVRRLLAAEMAACPPPKGRR